MNTDELYDMLWLDPTVSSQVMAVVPCNALKYISDPRKHDCYIINTNENSYLHGDMGHWMFLRIHDWSVDSDEMTAVLADELSYFTCNNSCVCGLSTSMSVEIFDALGHGVYNEEVTKFIESFNSYSVNKQYISNTHCGFYALVYGYYRCREILPSCILNILNAVSDIQEHCSLLYGLDIRSNNEEKDRV